MFSPYSSSLVNEEGLRPADFLEGSGSHHQIQRDYSQPTVKSDIRTKLIYFHTSPVHLTAPVLVWPHGVLVQVAKPVENESCSPKNELLPVIFSSLNQLIPQQEWSSQTQTKANSMPRDTVGVTGEEKGSKQPIQQMNYDMKLAPL